MPDSEYERRDIDGRVVFLFGIGLAGFILLAMLVLGLLFGLAPSPAPFGFGTGLDPRTTPMLQQNPRSERHDYEAEKHRALHTYGWVDRSRGIARLPIEDAMRIIAEGGIPDWGQPRRFNGGDCGLLAQNIPRAPQTGSCYPATAAESR